MQFSEVHLSEGRELNGALSATFLRAFNSCRRAAYLYQEMKGGASEPQLERGSAIHAVFERSLLAAIDAGEPMIPGELVKAIGDEVLADPQFHVAIEEHDFLRESLWRWASWITFDPRNLVAVERLMVLDVGDWRIRMKLDYAETFENGKRVLVRDWKSSRSAPSYEDIGRRRAVEGRVAPKSIQLVLYALGIVHGRPVEVTVDPLGNRTETVLPFPLADRAQHIDLELVFPGIEDKATGGPLIRALSLTRIELEEYRTSVEGLLERVTHAVDTGDWRAIQGEGHCGECPAPALCPIPEAARKFAPNVDSVQEAAAEAEGIERDAAALKARRKRLNNFVKGLPEQRLRFGADMVIEPCPTSTTTIKDKDGFVEAAQRAADFGESFEVWRFVKTTTGTPIRPRRLSEAEIEEEIMDNMERQAGLNG